jgi:SlyX protein
MTPILVGFSATNQRNRTLEADMESRLAEIEAKLSFCEELLDGLNRTVYRQQQQIDQLQLELRALCEQVRNALPAEARNLRDETPPHY